MTVYLHQRNSISKTGVIVSPLGLGMVKLGRDKSLKYKNQFKIASNKQALEFLACSWDYGINLIDTAPAYGNSEHRLGELLPKLNKDWVISTKVGEIFSNITERSTYNFAPKFIVTSVKQSLKRLKRDVLDIVLIHSDGNDTKIIEQGALEVLSDLKRQGWIRASGMSTKSLDGGLLALKHSDLAMIMYNPKYRNEQKVFEQALKNDKSIFIKKAFSSGHLINSDMKNPIQASFNLIFQEPSVSSIIIGTMNAAHMKDNVKKAMCALKK
ncbi:MAG: aldo/keto reductase [Piscirickettsiaceae bacterium]|nr:aldo/keto reductase [Piscirickettsiaceae bacterium]